MQGTEIYVANFDTVFRFKPSGEFIPFVSHPSCSDIHDIAFMNDSMYVTSTRNDLLLIFDCAGRLRKYHNAREWTQVKGFAGWRAVNLLEEGGIHAGHLDFRDPRTHEKDAYDGAHLNSVCLAPDGTLYVSLGLVRNEEEGPGKACVVRLREGRDAEILYMRHNVHVAIHNLVMQPDRTLLFLDTGEGELVRLRTDDGEVLSRHAFSSEYLRGLCRFEDGRLVIGDQNSVLFFDPATPSATRRVVLSENSRESVHSIAVLK
ncbi:MAG: hypothetical protein K1Y02_06345 [Candidatus Hydrogenedentes bacterium]|nr:hypothetical protein [Candidatus Hydrogenedentota bacterium]